MGQKNLYSVVGLFFDNQRWHLSFATSADDRYTTSIYFANNTQGYEKIVETIKKEFFANRFTSSRVFLLYSPPESTSLFPVLYRNFPPVVVVHPKRLMLHRKRLGRDYPNKSEMLAEAAITGLSTDLLLIETTNVCTFSCLFCPQDQMTRKKERLPFETAKQIVMEYATNSVGSIAFHLMGEPTSNPYLPKLVGLVADLAIDHTLTTNGSTLTKEMSIELFRNGLKRAQLSVQTFGERQFYAFKRPAPKYSYETVLENIKNFFLAKWQYAPDAEIEIHVMDNSLYQPRGVAAVCDDNRAREVARFWQDFLLSVAQETGDENIISRINQSHDVKLVRDSWNSVNLFFEPTISLKFKMAGHWTQEFLKDNEVIITAYKGICQQIANGGNNQLAVQSSGDVVLCCFDFDGGTKIGNIKNYDLKSIDNKANKFREKLLNSSNLPFEICKRCLGIRINLFSMGTYKCSGKKEISFSNIALYWLNGQSILDFNRFRQAGIPQLSIIVDSLINPPENCLIYTRNDVLSEVEAIIFPSDWLAEDNFIKKIIRQYPDKFIGQINMIALNPFDRNKITAHKQNSPNIADNKITNNKPKRQKSFWGNCTQWLKNITTRSLNKNYIF